MADRLGVRDEAWAEFERAAQEFFQREVEARAPEMIADAEALSKLPAREG